MGRVVGVSVRRCATSSGTTNSPVTRNPAVPLATIRTWTADYLATAIALAEAHLRATRSGIRVVVDGKEVTMMTRGDLATSLDRMYRVRAERRKDAERPGRDDLGDPDQVPGRGPATVVRLVQALVWLGVAGRQSQR
jgi:hypothetical protein